MTGINHSSEATLLPRAKKNNSSLKVNLSPLYFAGLLAFGCVSMANAAIVADAGQASRPSVNVGENGATVIDINAAGKGGVSHNIFNQFDVDKNGVVLNNSVAGANSQLAGNISGNANLSGGAASVILNEVNSNKASVLNGLVEVGGQQAQVIIANPAGITCSGCGFINASRATLTTGVAQISDGTLQGYKTEKGTIVINGDGLKSADSNYTDLIARSVEINAGVWAKDLKVTTGRNTVNADNTQVTALAAASGKPAVGIDVSALGGMYAGKITLVGTESGVGVRNAGTIGASASDLVMDINGVLDNRSGTLTASRAANLKTVGELDNTSGQIKAGSGGITINTNKNRLTNTSGNIATSGLVNINSGQLNNTNGMIQASTQVTIDTNGQTLTNTGRASGAGIFSTLGMTLKTGQLNNNNGQIATAGKATIVSGALDNRDGQIYAFGLPFADLDMTVGGTFDNRNGEIAAQRNITLATTGAINNSSKGKMSANTNFTLTTNKTALNNTDGLIEAAGTLDINSGELTNSNGTLQSTKTLSVNTNGRNLANNSGAISSKGDINLTNINALNNGDGRISGDGKLLLQSSSLDNRLGGITMAKGNDVRVTNTLNNNHGVIGSTLGTTAVYANTLNNNAGVLGGLDVHAEAVTLQNDAGLIYAEKSAQVKATTIYNRNSKNFGQEMGQYINQPDTDGGIVSKGDLSITSSRLYNSNGLVASTNGSVNMMHDNVDNTRGIISAVKDLSLSSATLTNANGTIAGTSSLYVGANSLNNNNGSISSKGISTLGVNSAFTNAGSISGSEGLDISVYGTLTNSGELLSDKVTTINSQHFNNQRGAVTTGLEGVKLNLTGNYTNNGTVNGPVTKQ